MNDKFPCKAWMLGGTFIPREVEVLGLRWKSDLNWLSTSGKACIHRDDLFDTKASAIAEGKRRLIMQEETLKKRQADIDKKRSNLIKHA